MRAALLQITASDDPAQNLEQVRRMVRQAASDGESAGYAPGDRAVVANPGLGRIGPTICYDLRFADLYRVLAQAGAEIASLQHDRSFSGPG